MPGTSTVGNVSTETLTASGAATAASFAATGALTGVCGDVTILHTSSKTLQVLGILELACKASSFHERAVQLLIKLDAAACERSASSSSLRAACWEAAGPSEQPQGGIVRPRSGLLQEPYLHAGRSWRKSSL